MRVLAGLILRNRGECGRFVLIIILNVAHLFVLGAQVALEGVLELDLGGDALDHGNAGGLECGDLCRIVCDEANLGDAEQLEDFSGQLVFAAVGGEAQLDVGFHCVHALILQFVCLQFGHEADAAALLLLVEEDARAGVGDFAESQFELETAIAAKGTEDIAGEALGVDADQRRCGVNVAHDEGHEAFDLFALESAFFATRARPRELTLEAQDPEGSPAGGEIRFCDLLDALKCHRSILQGAEIREQGIGEQGSGNREQRASPGVKVRRLLQAVVLLNPMIERGVPFCRSDL